MNQDKKYYTPDATDLRIGYECEVQDFKGNWDKLVIKSGWSFSWVRQDISKGIIRTSYLSKEDIESEGWIYEERVQLSKFSTINHLRFRKIWDDGEEAKKKGGWLADGFRYEWVLFAEDLKPFYGIDKIGKITIQENKSGGIGGINETYSIFKGTCPSINELRKIQQYIGIK